MHRQEDEGKAFSIPRRALAGSRWFSIRDCILAASPALAAARFVGLNAGKTTTAKVDRYNSIFLYSNSLGTVLLPLAIVAHVPLNSMKKSNVLVVVIWAYGICMPIVGPRMIDFGAMGASHFPWQIVFMPLVIVVGAFFNRDLPGEFTIGRWVDGRFGLGSYREFMGKLRYELLIASGLLSISLTETVRSLQPGMPAAPIEIREFFASGAVAFVLVYFIHRRDQTAPEVATQAATTRDSVATPTSQDILGFWKEARLRRDIAWIVFGGWLIGGPLLVGLFSLILPQSPMEARGFAALACWGALMLFTQYRVTKLRCYNCGKQAFSSPMFLWRHARCRNCGVSPTQPCPSVR